MRAADAEPLLAVFGDPVVMAAFEMPPFDPSQMETWVRDNLDHREQFGYGLFTVVLRESGDVIGDCGLETKSLDGTVETELGYDLRRDTWGRGLATEAARAVARHAFDDLGLQRLVSLVRPHNVRSARVAEKVGMRPERQMRSSGVEYVVYSMAVPAFAIESEQAGVCSTNRGPAGHEVLQLDPRDPGMDAVLGA